MMQLILSWFGNIPRNIEKETGEGKNGLMPPPKKVKQKDKANRAKC